MWKYINFKQNDVDPSPEARAQFGAVVDFLFKFAEYTLISGAFLFLAITTNNWAVMLIAGILAVALSAYLVSLVAGLRFFNWRDAPNWWLKGILFCLDALIFFAAFYTLQTAFHAVANTMRTGIGI